MLAIDRGPVPAQMGIVLVFDSGCDLDAVGRALVERVRAVPRLRRRLRRAHFGCGRQVWVDDPRFDSAAHIERAPCPAPGDERAVLDLAATVVLRRLPRSRPLWRATLVPGLANGGCAVILVAHHAIADGLRGLAVLAAIADGVPVAGRRALPTDAQRKQQTVVREARRWWRALHKALSASGGLRSPRAETCSLLQPTGPHRRLATCRVDLARFRSAAHDAGGSVNDAALAAVAGALHVLLSLRGEHLPSFRVAVPVGARVAGADEGNAVTPLVVEIPACGDVGSRLRTAAGRIRGVRPLAAGPSILTLLAPAVRVLAALGGYRYYLAHQRRLHTLFSYLRGQAQPFAIAGAPVRALTPIVVGMSGNVAVSFVAVSYAGTLTVTIVADPDAVPEVDALAAALQAELDAIADADPDGWTA